MAEFTILPSPPADGREQISLKYSILKIDSPNGTLWVRLDLSDVDVTKVNSQKSQEARVKVYQEIYDAALDRFRSVLDAKMKVVESTKSATPDYNEMFLEAGRLRDSNPAEALRLYREVYAATKRLPYNEEWKKKIAPNRESELHELQKIDATGTTPAGSYSIEVSEKKIIIEVSLPNKSPKKWEFSPDQIQKQVNRQGIIWTKSPEDFKSLQVREMTCVSLVKHLLNSGNNPLVSGSFSLGDARPLLLQLGPAFADLLVAKNILKAIHDPSLPEGMRTLYYDPNASIDISFISTILRKKDLTASQVDSVIRVVSPQSSLTVVPRVAENEANGVIRLEFGRNPNGEFSFSFVTTDNKPVSLVLAVAASWLVDKKNSQAKEEIRRRLEEVLKPIITDSKVRTKIIGDIVNNSQFEPFLDTTRKQAKTGYIVQ